jgi:hypothetical protein
MAAEPTELLTPVGHNKYDSLQTSLQRRMSHGVSLNFNYTFSKALGICCDDLSDGYPSIQIPQYMRLNRAVMPYDRPHTFGAAFLAETPFGRGRPWSRRQYRDSACPVVTFIDVATAELYLSPANPLGTGQTTISKG